MFVIAEDMVTNIAYICSIDDIELVEKIINFLEKINSSRFNFYYEGVLEDTECITVNVDSVRKFVDVVVHILLTELCNGF